MNTLIVNQHLHSDKAGKISESKLEKKRLHFQHHFQNRQTKKKGQNLFDQIILATPLESNTVVFEY
jgi:hypothetical protein